MDKVILILFATAVALITQANSVSIFNCMTGKLDNKSVDLFGCTSLPCTVVESIPHDFSIKFTPTSNMNNLIVRASRKPKGGKWKPLAPYDGLNACNYIYKASNNKQVSCPLKRHVSYKFESQGLNAIEASASNVTNGRFRIHWALEHNGSDISCYEIDVINKVTRTDISFTIIQ